MPDVAIPPGFRNLSGDSRRRQAALPMTSAGDGTLPGAKKDTAGKAVSFGYVGNYFQQLYQPMP